MHAYYGMENSANLWTDKFSPRVLADLVGNSSAIATLRTWLSNWPGNQATGKASKVSTRKAILISGAPGIGKTTSAILICRELGFQTMNVNASDSRGKTGAVSDGIAGTLASTVREFVTNRNIGIDGPNFKPYIPPGYDNDMIEFECVPKGDSKYLTIAAASILAKDYHTKYIKELVINNEILKLYDIQKNKGYGTKSHLDAIHKNGITDFHRKTFGICKNYAF